MSLGQYGSLYFSQDIKDSKACHYFKRERTEVHGPRYTIGSRLKFYRCMKWPDNLSS